LAAFLRSELAQEFIANYGLGTLDAEPLFFRVTGRP
jgi:hypothetical protein